MVTYLSPEFNIDEEILFGSADGEVKFAWFVDYTDQESRHVRDILLRSADRFAEHDSSLAMRFVAREGGSPSDWTARAAIAAHWQGQLGKMHEAIYDKLEDFSKEGVIALAKDLGLDVKAFIADLTSDRTQMHILRGAHSYETSNAPRLPAFFINGRLYEGVWDEEDILEALQRPMGYRIRVATLDFVNWAASAGAMMIIATFSALLFVNIGFAEIYEYFLHLELGIVIGSWSLLEPMEIWINDGLMALFFLLVGMEIKHEIVEGELSSWEKASMPVYGALGGMIVPALIYVFFNQGTEYAHGWGVPMATDIAFTLGILALVSSKVPVSLKVFISALAIADDLGAIVVIAIFYGHGFDFLSFGIAIAIFAIMIGLNSLRIYNRLPYMILGVFLWYFVFQSGVHATVAGVLIALAIPLRPAANLQGVAANARQILADDLAQGHAHVDEASIGMIQSAFARLRSPGFMLQKALERWCNFFILPVFAFFNTGIVLSGAEFSLSNSADAGILFGLLIGKPLGICAMVFGAQKLGWGKLSAEIGNTAFFGAAILCGIGFTMSIFIASASFHGEALESAKLAILLASALAAIFGALVLRYALRENYQNA